MYNPCSYRNSNVSSKYGDIQNSNLKPIIPLQGAVIPLQGDVILNSDFDFYKNKTSATIATSVATPQINYNLDEKLSKCLKSVATPQINYKDRKSVV